MTDALLILKDTKFKKVCKKRHKRDLVDVEPRAKKSGKNLNSIKIDRVSHRNCKRGISKPKWWNALPTPLGSGTRAGGLFREWTMSSQQVCICCQSADLLASPQAAISPLYIQRVIRVKRTVSARGNNCSSNCSYSLRSKTVWGVRGWGGSGRTVLSFHHPVKAGQVLALAILAWFSIITLWYINHSDYHHPMRATLAAGQGQKLKSVPSGSASASLLATDFCHGKSDWEPVTK